MAARVVTVPPYHNHPGLLYYDDRTAVVRTVTVVLRVSVAVMIRTANDNTPGDVRVSKAQYDSDPSLGLRDTSRESQQQSNKNECAFHVLLLGAALGKRRATEGHGSK